MGLTDNELRDKLEIYLNRMIPPAREYQWQGRNHYSTYPDRYGTFLRVIKPWIFEQMFKIWNK